MKNNKTGFSIMIGMGLTLLITLSSYVILSYMIPYAKNIKGIENASNSYYLAYGGVEESLYHIKTREDNITSETGSAMSTTGTGISYQTTSSGTTIPKLGNGNSDYSPNYNIISKSQPIQISVGNGYLSDTDWPNVDFIFRVPAINGINGLTLSGSSPTIYWMLSSENDTLMASGSEIKTNEINKSGLSSTLKINSKQGLNLLGGGQNFQSFYDSNCEGPASGCTLKMAIVVDKLQLNDANKTEIPYLEYMIKFGGHSVPMNYTTIDASGKSYGFKKDMKVDVMQKTTNQAFDFTIFQ